MLIFREKKEAVKLAKQKQANKMQEILHILELVAKEGGDFDAVTQIPVKEETAGEKAQKKVSNQKQKVKEEEIADDVHSSLLHIVIKNLKNCLPVIKFLIEKAKVNVNTQRYDGKTPLIFLLETYKKNVDLEVLDFLLNNGSNLDLCDKQKNTALFKVCDNASLLQLNRILKFSCQKELLNKDGDSPLNIITKTRNLALIKALVEGGANINFVDAKKRNALHIIISQQTKEATNEIEKYLISNGCDTGAVDVNGRVPLHYALVKIGEPFNNSSFDPIEKISFLLSKEGVLKTINVQDSWGNTPLHYAVQRNAAISTLLLLKKGAEIDSENLHGNSPLYVGLLNDHMNLCISLLQNDASIKKDLTVYTRSQLENILSKKLEKERKEKEKLEKSKSQSTMMELEINEDDNNSYASSDEEESQESKSASSASGNSRNASDADEESSEENNKNSEESNSEENEDEDEEDEEDGENDEDGDESSEEDQDDKADGAEKEKEVRAFKEIYNTDIGKAGKKMSPFMYCLKKHWEGVCFLMIEQGFDLSRAVMDCIQVGKWNYAYSLLFKSENTELYNGKNSDGQNIAHLFSEHSGMIPNHEEDEFYMKFFDALKDLKVDFTAKDNKNRSCLHYGSVNANNYILEHVLKQGLDINEADIDGKTPLGIITYEVIDHTYEPFLKIASKYSLDINKEFVHKKEVYRFSTYATTKLSTSFVIQNLTLFKKYGGDLDLGDSKGRTPLMLLVRENLENLAK
jgi:ankyrin repeat protein